MNISKPKNKLGYTRAELDSIMTPNEREKFNQLAGVNTCAIDEKTGESLMYPWDVEKFLAIVRGERGPEELGEWD